MMNDDDNPDRERPTDPPVPVDAIETIEPAPEAHQPEQLPHELDPHFEYKTGEWAEGDYKGEPHPWQTTHYIK